MSKKVYTHDQQLYHYADATMKSLGWIAPEDTGMRRTKVYEKLVEATEPLRDIHVLMDGEEWSPDTLNEIAAILRAAGFTVRGPE